MLNGEPSMAKLITAGMPVLSHSPKEAKLGLWAKGISEFHAVVDLALELPKEQKASSV
jgi:hypothetical protein